MLRAAAIGAVAIGGWLAIAASAAADCVGDRTLTASDPADGDWFGHAVAVDGDVAVVGAPRGEEPGNAESGLAYVLRLVDGAWSQEAKLTASDGADDDHFGFSVSVSGDVAVVGAPYTDAGGAVYVFRFDGNAWNEEQILAASDGTSGIHFGTSVSISGDAVLVGAPHNPGGGHQRGAAYVFRHDGSDWTEEARLTASDGADGDWYGWSVSIGGDVAIVGALFADNGGEKRGSAYIYRFDGATWTEEPKLTASDGADIDYFGNSVSISGDVALVGAPPAEDPGEEATGFAYVFRYNGATWSEEARLRASDRANDDFFGTAVAVAGDVALIGSPGANAGSNDQGSGYLFRYDGESWVEEAKLVAPDGTRNDELGFAVAISGDVVMTGAPFAEDGGRERGSVYAFCAPGCVADLDGNGSVGFPDLVIVLAAWGNSGGPEDLDGDGVVGFPDVIALLAAWGNCPFVGACCLGDEGGCAELSEPACFLEGGTFRGRRTACDDECVPGACCFADGSCTAVIEESCVAAGGFYQGDGTACADGCPAMGACCTDDGDCQLEPAAICDAAGGLYRGDDTTCDACEPLPTDECEDAPVVGDGVYFFSTVDTTTRAPFSLPAQCDEGNGVNFRSDVWVRYTAACDGEVVASTCRSTFDTRMAVYETDDCPGAFVACNDDACGDDGTRSEVRFTVREGEQYLVRIGARGSGIWGVGELVIRCKGGG